MRFGSEETGAEAAVNGSAAATLEREGQSLHFFLNRKQPVLAKEIKISSSIGQENVAFFILNQCKEKSKVYQMKAGGSRPPA
jgi:hypothetical protein